MISIIVPVFNVERYLDKCLNSITKQTYSNFEAIIVDDGSTDNSKVIVNKYLESDNRFKYFYKDNGGLSSARNFGIEMAKGEFICFLDSDDHVDSDYILYLKQLIDKYNCKISGCWHKLEFSNGSTKEVVKKRGTSFLQSQEAIKNILYNDKLDTTANCKLIHKSLLDNKFFPEGKNYEDIGSIYKLFLDGEGIAVGFEAKYYYYMRNDSITHESFNSKKLDLIEMTDRMSLDVLSKYPNLQKAVLRRRVYSRFSTVNQMLDIDEKNIYYGKRNEYISFIKKHGLSIILDRKAPMRDKLATLAMYLGFRIYRTIWNFIGKN